MLTLTAIAVIGMLHAARPALQAVPNQCLHEANETPDQIDRRTKAVGLARAINTAEAAYKAGFGSYGKLEDLVSAAFMKPAPASGEYVPGFKLRLDVMDTNYWFSVTDTIDPCGFRFISNQDGLIFNAEPMR